MEIGDGAFRAETWMVRSVPRLDNCRRVFFCSLPKEMIVDVLVAQLPVLLLYELLIAPTILFPKNSEAFGVLG